MVEKVETLDELYSDRTLYSSKDMFSPPSERLPWVIRFELTTGCNWGKCTYCSGFDGVRYHEKSLEGYAHHVDAVLDKVPQELTDKFTRIFIGGGNALQVQTDKLKYIIELTDSKVKNKKKDYYIRRISLYGRTDSILKKGWRGLRELRYAGSRGLDLVYWGVESGSNNVLDYVNKGGDKEDIIEAGNTLNNTGINSSVMVMPGLGGIKFFDEHAEETAKVLGKIRPDFITFMGVSPNPHSEYAIKMRGEVNAGINRPLTDWELVEQMQKIIRLMPANRGKVGCFNQRIDSVGHNPITFGSRRIYSEEDRHAIANELGQRAEWIRAMQTIPPI